MTGISFQQPRDDLEIAAQLEHESAAASVRPSTSYAAPTNISESQHNIHFAGHGKYVQRNFGKG